MFPRNFFCSALLMLAHCPFIASAANNVFLPPTGGDLVDPANWSNGVVPTQPSYGFIPQEGPLDLTVSRDSDPIRIVWKGDNVDASLDLQGHSVEAAFERLYDSVNAEDHLAFQNGTFLSGSYLHHSFGTTAKANIELENVTWDGEWRISTTQGTALLTDGSFVRKLEMTGLRETVELRGGSSITGGGHNQVFRLDGTELAKLVVDEGSHLGPGLYRLNTRFDSEDPAYPAELVIRGGSTTSADMELRISPISTILIEGEGTHAEFQNLNLAAGFTTIYAPPPTPQSIMTVRDGAKVTVHGPPPSVDDPIALQPTDAFSLDTLKIQGVGTEFESHGYGGFAARLSVSDGAKITSEKPIHLVHGGEIENSIVNSSLDNEYPFSSFLQISSQLTIYDSEVHGNISGFKQLLVDDALIEGNVNVDELIGDATIEGDVGAFIRQFGGSVPLHIILDDHLSITGDLSDANVDYLIKSSTVYTSLDVGTSIDGRSDWDIIPDYIEQHYFSLGTHIKFADFFTASLGDRFTLLNLLGGTLEFNTAPRPSPDGMSPEEYEALQRDLLNITIDNLPAGYAIDVFATGGQIGFVVTTVPESSTLILCGVALVAAGMAVRLRTRGRQHVG